MSLLFQPFLAWFIPASLLLYWLALRESSHRRLFLMAVSGSLLVYFVGAKRALPLGVSYFVFRLIHYAFGRYRGTIERGRPQEVLTYLFFFPLLPAGPLEPYNSFFQKQERSFEWPLFLGGMRRMVWGYFKKAFLVDLCLAAVLQAYWAGDPATHHPFLFVSLKFLEAYLDLSAYTDLAIGFSALFGFRIMENFGIPFSQTSVAKFWQHWHMSITQWCRDHVFFPVLGYSRRPVLAIYASMLVMGLWHGLSTNWAAWGLYHATGIVVSQRASRYYLFRTSHPIVRVLTQGLSIAATLAFVILGFSLVSVQGARPAARLFVACLQ
ncbi:MAG: MBOAT family protein [Bdellovibrionales bacterium]|nr:MBOAT family protein [Bdellovibrionales bacterium]